MLKIKKLSPQGYWIVIDSRSSDDVISFSGVWESALMRCHRNVTPVHVN